VVFPLVFLHESLHSIFFVILVLSFWTVQQTDFNLLNSIHFTISGQSRNSSTDLHYVSGSHFSHFHTPVQRFFLVFHFHVLLASFLITQSLSILQSHNLVQVDFFSGRNTPQWPRASLFTRFLDHTLRRTTVGRTPLGEWSVHRRDLYLTTHNTHNRQTSMPPLGFEPTISAGGRSQTYALDRAGRITVLYILNSYFLCVGRDFLMGNGERVPCLLT
jgi:hypothetical protein